MPTNTNDTTTPRDPKDAHDATAARLYESDRKPMPDTKGQMYTWSPAGAAFDGRANELFVDGGLSHADVQAHRDTFHAIGRETGLPDVFLGTLATATIDRLLASRRVSDDPEADDLAFNKALEAHTRESREQLMALYGTKDAAGLIDRAHRFVKSHPKLAKLFKDHQLGSRPDIVLPLVDHIRKTGWRK